MSAPTKSPTLRLIRKANLALAGELVLPLLVLALAVFVYGLYGFDGTLMRDYSIYLYSGQQLANGVPPYVSVFDHKGPLSPMIAGLGVLLSKLLGSDDVLTVRLLFFSTACLAVLAVYLLGKSAFRSQTTGFFAALTFLGFYPYGYPAGSGPEPKTPMVLFEALSLLFMVKKRWFWAGLFGSLAFLVWQPMGIFVLATFVLAAARPKGERVGASLRAVAGIAAPIVAVLAYFYYFGALRDLWDGVVLFNVLYVVRDMQFLTQVADAGGVIAETYTTLLVPIIIGLVMVLRLYFLRPYQHRFAPILLSFPAIFLWSLTDFQLSDDFFPFLPYVAIGFGAFLTLMIEHAETPRLVAGLLGVILLALALGNTFAWVNADAAYAVKGTDISLSQQRQGALEVEKRLGENAKLASINSPQVLVLLHRTNPNPYLFITAGVDREIEAQWPGGFEGWLQGLESNTDAIAFFGEGQSLLPTGHLTDVHQQEFNDLLDTSRYQTEKIGPWWLFVKDSSTASAESQQGGYSGTAG